MSPAASTSPTGTAAATSRTANCLVCRHPQREQIDLALLSESVRRVALRFGVAKTTLHDHRSQHLPALLAQAYTSRELRMALTAPLLRERLEQLHSGAETIFQQSLGVENHIAIRALGVMNRQIEMALRVSAATPQGGAVPLSQFEVLSQGILNALANFPEAKLEVARALRAIETGLYTGHSGHPADS